MRIDENSLKQAEILLNERANLKKALETWANYDSRMSITFYSGHNNNTKIPIKIDVPMPIEFQQPIIEAIKEKISTIDEKLKQI